MTSRKGAFLFVVVAVSCLYASNLSFADNGLPMVSADLQFLTADTRAIKSSIAGPSLLNSPNNKFNIKLPLKLVGKILDKLTKKVAGRTSTTSSVRIKLDGGSSFVSPSLELPVTELQTIKPDDAGPSAIKPLSPPRPSDDNPYSRLNGAVSQAPDKNVADVGSSVRSTLNATGDFLIRALGLNNPTIQIVNYRIPRASSSPAGVTAGDLTALKEELIKQLSNQINNLKPQTLIISAPIQSRPLPQSQGYTKSQVDSLISGLTNQISGLRTSTGNQTTTIYQTISSMGLSNKIDQLTGVTINGGKISGGLSGLSASDIPALSYLSTNGGNVIGSFGSGTTSPWAELSINPNGITGSSFAIGSSTATDFVVTNGGLVGIGTSSPFTNLSVSGNTYVSGDLSVGGVVISSSGAISGGGTTTVTNLIVTNISTSTFAGGLTVESNKLLVDNLTGKVGIGTTTPSSLLSLQGSALFSGNLTLANLTATGTLTFSSLGTSMLTSINSSGVLSSTSTPTAAYYLATSSIASSLPYASTTALSSSGSAFFATSGGNVGVGSTSTPGSLFSVNGITNLTAATSSFYSTGGISITGGCFAVGTTCVGGSGATNSGTTNRLSYYSGATTLDSANFLATDITNQRFGVGSSTPTATLSIAALNGAVPFAVSTSTASATSTAFVIDAQGRVGIGTSTPDNALTIIGSVSDILSTSTQVTAYKSSFGTSAVFLSTLNDITVVGKYLYASGNGNFDIFDVSNPFVVTRLSSTSLGSGSGGSVVVKGKYAYVGSETTFTIYDISNPNSPKSVITTPAVGYLSKGADGLAVQGRYAYLALYNSGNFLIVDVSNPTSPVIVSTIGTAQGLHFSSGARKIFVSGNYAYITNSTSGFVDIIDVSNPTNPVLVSSLSAGDDDVYVSERYAYTISTSSVLTVYDISNAYSPVSTSTVTIPGTPESLVGSGRYLYVSTQSPSGLAVFDVANPVNPQMVYTRGLTNVNANGDSPLSVAVSGRNLYLGLDRAIGGLARGMEIVDTSAIESSAMVSSSFETGRAFVRDDIIVGGQVQADNGLTVGVGGIYSIGPLSVSVASTTQNNPVSAYFQSDVSVGTTSPYSKLSVWGSGTGTNRLFELTNNSSTTLADFLENGTGYFLGSIGIGTTTPSNLFSVQGDSLFSGNLTLANLTATGTLTVQSTTATSTFSTGGLTVGTNQFVVEQTSGSIGLGTSTPWAELSINPNGIAGPAFAVGSSTANYFEITNGGFVGVGTTAPAYSLDIASTTRTTNLIAQNLTLSRSYSAILSAVVGSSTGYVNFSGGIGSGGSDSINNAFNSALRITSAGNLVNIGSVEAGETLLTKAGTFASKTDYTSGSIPEGVAIGDLNGDGKADLAVVNNLSNTVSVFINKGDGTFFSKVDYTTGSAPRGVAIGDLNGDGKADLVVTNTSSATISVFINKGDGTFFPKVDYTTGSGPYFVAIGDLNGDGKPDLAVVNNGSNTVSVFTNNGDGTFASKVDYTTGSQPNSVAIGDLNGDGRADMAVANLSDNNLSVFINKGGGTFKTGVNYTAGTQPFDVLVGDLNGDGKPDLAVTNSGSNTVSVFTNNGDGTFASKVDYTTGSTPQGLAIGDLNGDGKPDLAVGNKGDNTVSIFTNNGDGTLTPKVDYTTGTNPFYIAIGDLNGDGKPDILASDSGASSISVLMNQLKPMFYANVSSGNVGIGTSTPTTTPQALFAKLNVWGKDQSANSFAFNVADSASTTLFTITDSGLTGIGTSSPWANLSVNPNALGSGVPEFAIGSSTATHLLVDGAGNVGIGSTSPASLFSINGVANFKTSTSTFSSSGGMDLTAGCFSIRGTCVGGSSGSGTVNSGTTGQIPYYGAAGTALTSTSTIYLTTASKVGVSTSTSYADLTVWDNGSATGTIPVLTIANSASSTLFTVLENNKSGFGTANPSATVDISPSSSTYISSATGGTITYSGGYTIHTFTSSGTFTANSSGDVEVLIVAGGGGGGSNGGGGGGGGGVVYSLAHHVASGAITVTVGAGGGGSGSQSANGSSGSNSVFDTLTATGGGGGASQFASSGNSGGSGGGGAVSSGSPATPGSGTSGQGFNGGTGFLFNSSLEGGGGGGGGGSVGSDGSNNGGGNGGSGYVSSISGTSATYAGGGGGGGGANPGSGGSGGGGVGGSNDGGNGTANTGGGGGGGKATGSTNGGTGGSGIVIIRYPTSGVSTALLIESGSVAIGTSTPSTLFSVQGSANFAGSLTLSNLTATGTLTVQSTTATSTFSTGGLTVGTNQFVVQQNSGTVGIGTTTPWGLLSVNPNALGSGVPEFVIGSSTATHLIVDGAGNVGIDKSNPSEALDVTGNIKLSGVIKGSEIGTLVRNSANETISSGDVSTTFLTFDTEEFDTDNMHSTVSNTDRLTANTAGDYVISGTVRWAGNSSGFRETEMDLNGAGEIAQVRNDSSGSDVLYQNITTIHKMAVNDYVQLGVRQTSGGNLDVQAQASSSPRFSAIRVSGADVAEYYPITDHSIGLADLVALDSTGKLVRTSSPYQKPFGIISTNPEYIMGATPDHDNNRLVGLVGKVPLKVNLDGGDIHPGDPITSSSQAGLGMKATREGPIIGYALEDYTVTTTTTQTGMPGTIMVFLERGWNHEPGISAADVLASNNLAAATSTDELTDNILAKVKDWFASIREWVLDKLTAKEIQTDKLCVGSTCLTEDQLKQILDKNLVAPAAAVLDISSTTPSSVSSTTTPIDTTPPVITLNGDNPTTINKGDSFVDLGAIVTDNVDHNLGVEVSGDTVDTSKPATYHIHYNAADNAGNKAIEVIRTVNVIDPYAATSTPAATSTADLTATSSTEATTSAI